MSGYQSRFGADLGNLAKPVPAGPTCNPCKEQDHGRCAAVLGENGIVDSTFPCECYRRATDLHQDHFDDRQERFEAEREVAWERNHPWWDEL